MMIKKFSVLNYKGFKEKIIFDLSQAKDYKFNTKAIRNNLIKSSVIYGDVGSGKTNLGLALFDLTTHLVDNKQINKQRTNYLNGDSKDDYASFEYEFLIDDVVIVYKYKKDNNSKLLYEELHVNDKFIFKHNFIDNNWDYSGLCIIDITSLKIPEELNMSLLRFIVHNANISYFNIINYLFRFVKGMLWINPSITIDNYIGYNIGDYNDIVKELIRRDEAKNLELFLKLFNINYNIDVMDDGFNQSLIVKYDERNYYFKDVVSKGVMTLLTYYYWFINSKEISFIFIDEFDASLDYKAATKILFDSYRLIKHQVVLTSNNVDFMSNKILRPDCYFIINNNKIKSLPELTERELREGHNLSKIYKSGGFKIND